MAESKSRDAIFDIAKGIGILAVFIGHISYNGMLRILLYTFHLPLFFIISGYFFRYESDFKNFFLKKSRYYLKIYFGCAFMISCYFGVKDGINVRIFIGCIKTFIIQKRYTTLWFLAALYVAVILFGFICRFVNNDIKKLSLICCTLGCLFLLYEKYIKIPLPWNLDTAFIVLMYLATGYFLKNKNVINRILMHKYKIIIIAALFIISLFCTSINYLFASEYYEMYASQYGIVFVTIPAAITGSVGIILLSSYLKKIKCLAWLGRNSISFFAFHQAIAFNLVKSLPGFEMIVNNNQTIGHFILFIGGLIICYCIHKILIFVKLGWIVGC